jgi:hypothetical protein
MDFIKNVVVAADANIYLHYNLELTPLLFEQIENLKK